tara:strand:- start:643 stop:1047 length:405 start_codon:yes stop_codon:yes gene_type:complete
MAEHYEIVIKWKNKIMNDSLNFNDENPLSNNYQYSDLQMIDYQTYDHVDTMYNDADKDTKLMLDSIMSSVGKPNNRLCIHFDKTYNYYSQDEINDSHQDAGYSGIFYWYDFENNSEEYEFKSLLNKGVFDNFIQ